MHPFEHTIKSMNNLPILENYYKPIFDLFHLYIRGKCIIILYRRNGFGKKKGVGSNLHYSIINYSFNTLISF